MKLFLGHNKDSKVVNKMYQQYKSTQWHLLNGNMSTQTFQ